VGIDALDGLQMKAKKTLTSTPLPLNSKKKKKKNQPAPFLPGTPFTPSHSEFVKKNYPQ
jgi:hypothetical protein